MALTSSYKNRIGVRPVTTTSFIATTVAAGATSVKLVTVGAISTSDSLVIMDGATTEVREVTDVVDNTLTVAALDYAHTKGVYVFAMPTTGFGPVATVAMDTFKIPDEYGQIYDTSRVGSLVVQRGVVQGMRQSEWSFEGAVFPDTFGFVLASIFGTEVYTAGGATTPHSHDFSTLNSGNGQPKKHAWFVFDGVNCRVVVGKITKVSMKFAGGKTDKATYQATFMARASGVVTDWTPSLSTVPQLATWRSVFEIATTYVREVLSFTINLSREEAENIPTMTGTPDPLDTVYGALECTVKGTFLKTGDTQLDAYEKGTQQKFSLVIAPVATGATGTGIAFQASQANYDKVEPVLQGKAMNTEDFSFTAVANTSDAGTSGGISPCKIALKNAVGSGVYL